MTQIQDQQTLPAQKELVFASFEKGKSMKYLHNNLQDTLRK